MGSGQMQRPRLSITLSVFCCLGEDLPPHSEIGEILFSLPHGGRRSCHEACGRSIFDSERKKIAPYVNEKIKILDGLLKLITVFIPWSR